MTATEERRVAAETSIDSDRRARLVRRGFALEWITLGWNVVGIAVLASRSVSCSSPQRGSARELAGSTHFVGETEH